VEIETLQAQVLLAPVKIMMAEEELRNAHAGRVLKNIYGGCLSSLATAVEQAVIAITTSDKVADMNNAIVNATTVCRMFDRKINETMEAITSYVQYEHDIEVCRRMLRKYNYLEHLSREIIPNIKSAVSTCDMQNKKNTMKEIRVHLSELLKYTRAAITGIPPIDEETATVATNEEEALG